MTRCLVADDHPGVVAVLEDLLHEAGLDVVATAGNGVAAVQLATAAEPDCAIVDYRMPGLQGVELVRRLRLAAPGMGIVIYTAEASLELAEALDAGASGIVLKEAPLQDVVRAVESASQGRVYVDPALAALVFSAAPEALTERESEVLLLVAEGLSYEEIGGRLGIGGETARTHLKKARTRLGAATRTQAVATALRLGLIR